MAIDLVRCGQQASLVVQRSCTGRFWVTLLVGNIILLGGVFFPAVMAHVMGQLIFTICIILTLKEVK